jgi:hypothetical protein
LRSAGVALRIHGSDVGVDGGRHDALLSVSNNPGQTPA